MRGLELSGINCGGGMKSSRLRPMSEKKAAQVGRVFSTFTKQKKSIKKKPPKRELQQMGSPSRRRWVRSLPCCACGVVGYSENAHVTRRSGTALKGDHTDIVALCSPRPLFNGSYYRGCHAELDRRDGGRGREWLESTYRIDLRVCADQTERDYQLARAAGATEDFA